MIILLARYASPHFILEYGACEGVLTEKLMNLGVVDCVEKAHVYRDRLKQKGFNIVDNPDTSLYDIVIAAAFLEYLEDPKDFLQSVKSKFLLIDVILNSNLDTNIQNILSDYALIQDAIVRPRWEQMYHGDVKEKMETYRLGSHGYLFKQK